MFCFTLNFRGSHLTIRHALINFNKTDSKKCEEIHDHEETKYYIDEICHQFPNL